MIQRRAILKGGVGITAATLVAPASALAHTLGVTDKTPAVSLFTDGSLGAPGISPVSRNARLAAAGLSSVFREERVSETVLSDFRRCTEWLESRQGSTSVLAIDSRHSFIVDEVLRGTRSRVLFQGCHHAMELDREPVVHTGIELPVSAGVLAELPTSGAWTQALLASLARVATRQWSVRKASPRFSTHTVRSATATLSLATYVIET